MALPKLNDMPKYSVVVPSTKQEVRIRPFVVKEEKILLIAMESQDPKQIANAIMDTIVSCVQEPIERHKLTAYDVEYMFLQIRGKSVGETSNLLLKCQECTTENEFALDINDIKIHGEIPTPRIQLNDNVTVEMKPPTYAQIAQNDIITGEDTSDLEKVFALIAQSIGAVLTEEERIDFSEVSQAERDEFLESMTSEQFTKIREYMEKQPSLKHEVEFDCTSCGHHNKLILEGMQAFFS